jgi:hypothetical protein
MHRQPLDFERLDVYRCAIEFLGVVVALTARLPRDKRIYATNCVEPVPRFL